MADKSDKKTFTILLIVLAISIIGGGIWTYANFGASKIDQDEQANSLDPELQEVLRIKSTSVQNIENFLGFKNSPETIWDDFYSDKQFNSLKDIDTSIDIEGYLNNPNPFVTPAKVER